MPTTLVPHWEDAKRDCWAITSHRTASDLLLLTQGGASATAETFEEVCRASLEASCFLRQPWIRAGMNLTSGEAIGKLLRNCRRKLPHSALNARTCGDRLANLETHEARIHRGWLPCDTKVMDAWIRGRLFVQHRNMKSIL
jgi:hypothetical protein